MKNYKLNPSQGKKNKVVIEMKHPDQMHKSWSTVTIKDLYWTLAQKTSGKDYQILPKAAYSYSKKTTSTQKVIMRIIIPLCWTESRETSLRIKRCYILKQIMLAKMRKNLMSSSFIIKLAKLKRDLSQRAILLKTKALKVWKRILLK